MPQNQGKDTHVHLTQEENTQMLTTQEEDIHILKTMEGATPLPQIKILP